MEDTGSYAKVLEQALTQFGIFIKELGNSGNPAVILAGASVVFLFVLLAVVFVVASKSNASLSKPALAGIGAGTLIVVLLIAVGFVPQILDAQPSNTPSAVEYEGVYDGKKVIGALSFSIDAPGLWMDTNDKPDKRRYHLVYTRSDRLVMLEDTVPDEPRRVLEIATGIREIRLRWLGDLGSRPLYKITKVQ